MPAKSKKPVARPVARAAKSKPTKSRAKPAKQVAAKASRATPKRAASDNARGAKGAERAQRATSVQPSASRGDHKGGGLRQAGAEFEKVAFTMYPVKDPARARAFYEGTLGLTAGLQASNGMWTEYDLPGGGCLALFAGDQVEPSAKSGSIAFEVADLDALNVRLKAAGVQYVADLIPSPVCRMSIILDSEGNSIILHQLHRKR